MQAQRIKSVSKLGQRETLDFKVSHVDHNFYADGILVSNSHSAGYANLTALTVYLKYKYPLVFFLHLLQHAQYEPSPIKEISKIAKELPHFGIKLLSPHLLQSGMDFEIQGSNIRYGLSAIKGVSENTVQKIAEFRKSYSNKFDVFQAAKQNKIGIGILSALIQAGALDTQGQTRTNLVAEAQLWNLLTDKEKKLAYDLGEKCGYKLFSIMKDLRVAKNEKGKLIIAESRYQTLKKHYEPYNQIRIQNSKHERLANYFYENKLLGYSYSEKLFDIFKNQFEDLSPLSEIINEVSDARVSSIAEVQAIKAGTSKKGKYEKYFLVDDECCYWAMSFGKKIDDFKTQNGKKVEEGDILRFNGTKGDGIIFLNSIVIQNCQIYTKLSELKIDKTITIE